MWYRLAEIYHTPPSILRKLISPKEFAELAEYYSKHVTTERQTTEIQLAIIAAKLDELRCSWVGGRPEKVTTFIIDKDIKRLFRKRRQSEAEMMRICKLYARLYPANNGEHKQDISTDNRQFKAV